ncbi:MAG: NAD(P)H-quinone oxidoreductase chain 4 1 [Opitutia bacterium UBA7350]|nr:MAG: NAD(P)H-quinone oxidoreductase chain 4 1 [Opitutae bacterium UBA7350]
MFDPNATVLLAAILVPLFAGVVLAFGSGYTGGMRRGVALGGFGYPLVAAFFLAFRFDPAQVGAYNFESKLATGLDSFGIYLHLGLNGISLPLFLLAGVVGFAAGLYAMFSNAERPHLYLALMLFMQSGLMGTFASVDIFFFYFFHEFALIPTFIMIAVWGGTGRRTAAMEMTIYLTLGAMLSLLGLVSLYVTSGAESFSLPELRDYLATHPLSETLQANIFGLLLFGFGILVSLFPFHSWAPKGYASAPTGTAMLHAGVLKKFGLYGLLQIGVPLLPVGMAHWFPWLAWLALGNIIIIGLVTIAQRDLKLMLGYSSVMHMGYAFLGIAAFSVVGAGGALLMMVAHGLSVALLFMLSTCIYHRSLTFDLGAMGGLAVKAPVLCAFFVAASMASIGLPGFGNFWGEFTIFMALAETEFTRWLVLPAALGIIISAIYGLRAVANIFFGKPKAEFAARWDSDEVKDLQGFEKTPAMILLAALVVIGIFPRLVSDRADAELGGLYPIKESLPQFETTAGTPAVSGKEQTH